MNLLLLQQRFSKLIKSLEPAVNLSNKFEGASQYDLEKVAKNDLDFIRQQNPLSPSDRLFIYKNAYEIRLLESLEEDFPRVREILTAEVFWNLGKEYLKIYPSRYWSLGEIGKDFPTFLGNLNLKYPFISDLAKFEWLQIISSFMEEPKFFDFSTISSVRLDKQADIVLKLDTSVCFFSSSWTLHLENISQQDTLYLIYQKHGEVLYTLLSLAQWNILKKISEGLSISEIISSSLDAKEEEITDWFSMWVSEKIISHFELESA